MPRCRTPAACLLGLRASSRVAAAATSSASSGDCERAPARTSATPSPLRRVCCARPRPVPSVSRASAHPSSGATLPRRAAAGCTGSSLSLLPTHLPTLVTWAADVDLARCSLRAGPRCALLLPVYGARLSLSSGERCSACVDAGLNAQYAWRPAARFH